MVKPVLVKPDMASKNAFQRLAKTSTVSGVSGRPASCQATRTNGRDPISGISSQDSTTVTMAWRRRIAAARRQVQ